jgi:hypothetical protein
MGLNELTSPAGLFGQTPEPVGSQLGVLHSVADRPAAARINPAVPTSFFPESKALPYLASDEGL